MGGKGARRLRMTGSLRSRLERREHLERYFGPGLLFNAPAETGHGGGVAAARGGRRWQ